MAQPTPPLDPRLLQARAGERTTAIATAAIGAALLVAAAGTFIAITWETMGLAGKAGVVGFAALAALGAGYSLRNRVPGVAAVLVHLGGFLIPIDVGGVATALGVDRPEVGVLAGSTGAIALFLLDRFLLDRFPRGVGRSPFMAVGRVLSLGAVGLGMAAIAGGSPAVPVVLMAIVAAALSVIDKRFTVDALGLSLLSAAGPVLQYGASFSRAGSFLDWLAGLTETSPLTITLVAGAAIATSLLVSRRWPGQVVACAIGVITAPDIVSAVSSYHGEALVALAAGTLGARLLVHQSERHGWHWMVDLYTGFVTALTGVFVISQLGEGPQLAAIASAVLIIASWLASDVLSGFRLDPSQRLQHWWWHGASGPISTLGLVAAVLPLAAATADLIQAAAIVVVATTCLGLSQRPHATVIARSGFALGVSLALGDTAAAMLIGIAAAFLLMARALIDFFAGAAPRSARFTQVVGLGLLALAALRFPIADQTSTVGAVLAASGIAIVVIVIGRISDQLPIPDLRLWPRVVLAVGFVPLLPDLTAAGLWAIGLSVLLLVDHVHSRLNGPDVVAAFLFIAGSWFIGAGQSLTAIEMYVAGPSLVLVLFGARAMRDGDSSWLGLAPGIALFGSSALLERLAEGPGWHGALAGAVGLAALGLGVERKWSGPTVVGGLLLGAATVVEASAVVPRIPVWMLLAIGGATLMALGIGLERRAGVGQAAGFRATWARFT